MSLAEPLLTSAPVSVVRRDSAEQIRRTAAAAMTALGLLWMWADAALPQLQVLLPQEKWLPIAVAALGKALEVWQHYQDTGKIEIVNYSPAQLTQPFTQPASDLMLPEESEADTQSDPLGGDLAKNDG